MRLHRASFAVAFLLLAAAACSSSNDDTSQATSTAASSSSSSSTGGAGGSGGAVTSSTVVGTGGQGGDALIIGSADVKSYEYDFDLATAHATSKVTLDVTAHGECFTLPDVLPLTAPTVNGSPASSLDAPPPNDIGVVGPNQAAGASVVIGGEEDVPFKRYINGLDVGFSKTKDLANGTFTYLMSWVGGCDDFGPCDNDPSRLNEFHFDITHASSDVVLCPGVRTATATETKCDVTGTLAPTYSGFGLAADSKWVRNDVITTGSPKVSFFEVPGGHVADNFDAASFADYLDWIQTLLGPFPYGDELRFAGGPTVWLGFEHPANVILYEQLEQTTGAYLNPTQHVTMHETTHQWAGDRSTIATPLDFVWKEATAEYLSYVFEDEQRPAGEAAASLAYWDDISLQSEHYPRPTDTPPPAVQDFYGDVYGPGPMVLYVQLEPLIGRDMVLAGIQQFFAQPGARSVDDLRTAMESASGADLQAYFDAWVFGSGVPEWPTFELATATSNGVVTVTATQTNASGKIYPCKFDVEVKGGGQTTTVTIDYGLNPTTTIASGSAAFTGATVTSTTLDPANKIVANDAAAPYILGATKRHDFIL